MINVVVTVFMAVLLTSGLLVGCEGVVVKGSGNLKTEIYNFNGFNKVEVSNAFEVEVTQGSEHSVSITANDNLFEYIEISKQGTILNISLRRAQFIDITTKVEITMPQLNDLELSGAAQATVSGFSSTENLNVKISGASSVKLLEMSIGDVKFDISGDSKAVGEMTASDIEFDVSGASTVQIECSAVNINIYASGASNVQLGGSAGDIEIDASGVSYVELTDLKVDNADVNLSSSSRGTVNLNGQLDVNLSGASKLYWLGNPVMGNVKTTGASTLSKK